MSCFCRLTFKRAKLYKLPQQFAVLALFFFLTSCSSPEQQLALDQRQCAAYGFSFGTESFANCMFSTAQQRDTQEQENRLISAIRNVDTRYKVCNAASANSQLDVATGTWSGQNCRSR